MTYGEITGIQKSWPSILTQLGVFSDHAVSVSFIRGLALTKLQWQKDIKEELSGVPELVFPGHRHIGLDGEYGWFVCGMRGVVRGCSRSGSIPRGPGLDLFRWALTLVLEFEACLSYGILCLGMCLAWELEYVITSRLFLRCACCATHGSKKQ